MTWIENVMRKILFQFFFFPKNGLLCDEIFN